MRSEVISLSDNILVRRMVLEPGEAMPWHTDACRRFSVVVRGEKLDIQFRQSGERLSVDVNPGLADWDEPEERPHRAVNSGSGPYEEVVVFLLTHPGMNPQPEAP